jgi:hypothetical protein
MSTQRRVAQTQRFASMEKAGTELVGTAIPASQDAGGTGPEKQFRRVVFGLTAPSSTFQFGERMIGLATNSLSFSSCCEWHFRHGFNGSIDAVSSLMSGGTNGSSPASFGFHAGIFPEQLPLTSPLLSGASEQEDQLSAHTMQSALPRVPTGVCRGTERQHGQGNLYFKHATRNAACDSGRRSARRDLLRAGK